MTADAQGIAERYIALRQGRPSWDAASRLIYINPDNVTTPGSSAYSGLYDGHRFCEAQPGTATPHLMGDDVWFFGVGDHDDAPSSASLASPSSSLLPQISKRDVQNATDGEHFDLESNSNVHVPAVLAALMDPTANGVDYDVNATLPLTLPPTPEYLSKSFHPKTLGMRANKEELAKQLVAHRGGGTSQ